MQVELKLHPRRQIATDGYKSNGLWELVETSASKTLHEDPLAKSQIVFNLKWKRKVCVL